jgi:cephalosporin hydroxylase
MLEIGVFKGKYLSVLYEASKPGANPVVGIDALIGASNVKSAINEIKLFIKQVCGEVSRLNIVACDSTTLTADSLLDLLGNNRPCFISIDGGHTFDVVLKDLENCFPLIVDGGIIAIDDFFNHGVPEVTEAFFTYSQRVGLEQFYPFAHCYNKLFLTTAPFHEYYLRNTHTFLKRYEAYAPCQRTLARRQNDQADGYTPRFLGKELIPFF